ncbi:TPA: hypothetical protein I7730_01315 [Vibrio vulnificus]|uniref:Uncharacterized protein n=1 Tax=Vibrio vulnificus TaxID=672 RepID=A0A8H9K5Q2_VIBVL|nr:hypothetical protein [Vibrio vulnificus]HAS8538436.1 hypothetical protein [Vibrio vulnificus]
MGLLKEKLRALFKRQNETQFIGIDVESGGLHNATNLDDPSIPKGMTGAEHYALLEITVVLLNSRLEYTAKPLTLVLSLSQKDVETRIGKWSYEQFKTDLIPECLSSEVTTDQASDLILKYFNDHGVQKGTCSFFGNSIDLDKRFLFFNMPDVLNFAHYRNYDVSTFRVAFESLYGEIANYEKKLEHRTEADIVDSINQMKFYMGKFLKSPEGVYRNEMESIPTEPLRLKN